MGKIKPVTQAAATSADVGAESAQAAVQTINSGWERGGGKRFAAAMFSAGAAGYVQNCKQTAYFCFRYLFDGGSYLARCSRYAVRGQAKVQLVKAVRYIQCGRLSEGRQQYHE
jgi:hypothetical protein